MTENEAVRYLPPKEAAARLARVRAEVTRVIVGQERVIDRTLVALLSGGHCLLEGAPGLGKTRLLATLARTLGGSFVRIQFTPDLLPSDIVGTRIWRASEERFDVELGPVFANFVLADEINRAPAKVQSALLEVMGERQVSIGGQTFPVASPFLVLATQNPIESEGVYQLPEAQRDRFLMRVPVDYPANSREELEIVRRSHDADTQPSQVLSVSEVRAAQAAAEAMHVDPRVADYAVRLVLATRDPDAYGLRGINGMIAYGASPRASIGLVRGARALALLRGREQTTPQDVYDLAFDVLNHRLVLSFDAIADGISVDEVLLYVLTRVPAPRAGRQSAVPEYHVTPAPAPAPVPGAAAQPTGVHAPPEAVPPAAPPPAAAPPVQPAPGDAPTDELPRAGTPPAGPAGLPDHPPWERPA